ncbi:MAG: hypothetical protein M1814_004630 [Vezdaea aestivalis]|nr:MAG: hypothetical protein M1814_004630 [Vezdaea aestivalis]
MEALAEPPIAHPIPPQDAVASVSTDTIRGDAALAEAQLEDAHLHGGWGGQLSRITQNVRSQIPIPDRMMVFLTFVTSSTGLYLIRFTLASFQLAQWTAKKDYVQYCKDQQSRNSTDDKCAKLLETPLPPPPGLTGLVAIDDSKG